jgi:AcrR family transcriptional regulator
MNTRMDSNASSRGDATRNTLIKTAIIIFGRDGFDAASTRAISQVAGVNLALISYHFGGKSGLYIAALQHIADSISARIAPLLDAIEGELGSVAEAEVNGVAPKRALELLCSVTDTLVQVMTSDESADWARLILREQQFPSDGFDLLYHGFMRRVFANLARLARIVRHGEIGEEELKLCVVTIMGQVLVFRAARATIMRELDWRRFSAGRIELIKARLRSNIAAMLATEQPS